MRWRFWDYHGNGLLWMIRTIQHIGKRHFVPSRHGYFSMSTDPWKITITTDESGKLQIIYSYNNAIPINGLCILKSFREATSWDNFLVLFIWSCFISSYIPTFKDNLNSSFAVQNSYKGSADIPNLSWNALRVSIRCHHLMEKQRLTCQVMTPDRQISEFSDRLRASASAF